MEFIILAFVWVITGLVGLGCAVMLIKGDDEGTRIGATIGLLYVVMLIYVSYPAIEARRDCLIANEDSQCEPKYIPVIEDK